MGHRKGNIEEEFTRFIGHRNRIQSLQNRKGKFWCWTCDAYLVHPGQKCPNCGHKQKQRRLKD